MELKVRESWSEGGHEDYNISDVHLPLHGEQHIEIDFSVAEGTLTSFMSSM